MQLPLGHHFEKSSIIWLSFCRYRWVAANEDAHVILRSLDSEGFKSSLTTPSQHHHNIITAPSQHHHKPKIADVRDAFLKSWTETDSANLKGTNNCYNKLSSIWMDHQEPRQILDGAQIKNLYPFKVWEAAALRINRLLQCRRPGFDSGFVKSFFLSSQTRDGTR